MDKPRIQKIIEELLAHLQVSCKRIEISEDAGHLFFIVRTQESGILIGSNGDNLRAFNTLVRKIAERQLKERELNFLVDVNGYYSKRVRDIKQQAKILGDRARLFKSDIEMSPMNSYERMIVHALFAGDPDVYTESQGEGKTRRVVIRYKTPQRNVLSGDNSLLLS